MLIRRLSLTVALLAVASISAGAQEQTTTHMETHHVAVEHQVDTPDTSLEHEDSAQRLQQEADQLEKQAADHEQTAAEYRKRHANPKGANYAAMAKHCDRLAQNLKASAAEAREMARLHEDVAKLIAK